MQPSKEALDEFWAALDADNANRVRELFQAATLELEEAQYCLEDALTVNNISVDMIRALLSNGASTEQLSVSFLKRDLSIEIYRFLAENGLDVKDTGHLILE
jgi:hypothetical protein